VAAAKPNWEVPLRTSTTTPLTGAFGDGERPGRCGEGEGEGEVLVAPGASGAVALEGKAFLSSRTPTTTAATRMIALRVEVPKEK